MKPEKATEWAVQYSTIHTRCVCGCTNMPRWQKNPRNSMPPAGILGMSMGGGCAPHTWHRSAGLNNPGCTCGQKQACDPPSPHMGLGHKQAKNHTPTALGETQRHRAKKGHQYMIAARHHCAIQEPHDHRCHVATTCLVMMATWS